MRSNLYIILILIAVSVAGFLYFSGRLNLNTYVPSDQPSTRVLPLQSEGVGLGEHGIGEGLSGVVLEEYGDFSSEASKSIQPVIQRIKDKYGDDLRFNYHDFSSPLSSSGAIAAQQAADAAEMQGMFWQMHALLFERQSEWKEEADPNALFESYAREIGLAIEQYQVDLISREVKNAVNSNRQAAIAAGVSVAPALFVDGKQVATDASYDELVQIIEAAIATKSSSG